MALAAQAAEWGYVFVLPRHNLNFNETANDRDAEKEALLACIIGSPQWEWGRQKFTTQVWGDNVGRFYYLTTFPV